MIITFFDIKYSGNMLLGYKRFLFILGLVFFSIISKAGILTLSGVYQGKNIYVQNPFSGNMKDFCTNDVFINEVKVHSNIQASAYEIDLTHMKLNDPVNIKITHKDDCRPKILNPQVIKAASVFVFSSVNVDKSNISWATKGEHSKGKHFIEHFVNNSWITIKEIHGKESLAGHMNNYTFETHHNSGLNKYRVKFVEHDGQVFYSSVIEYTSDLPPVEFYPKRVTDKITLSRDADYEVLDAYGNVIRKGNSKDVNLADAQTGVYYLNVDNKTYKVFKK